MTKLHAGEAGGQPIQVDLSSVQMVQSVLELLLELSGIQVEKAQVRRSPSPRRFDGYPQTDRGYRGPPPSDYWRPSQNGLPARPTTANHLPTAASSNPPRPVQLPSRKGSNLTLPSKPPTVVQTKSNTLQSQESNIPSKAQGSNNGGRKKNKKKRAGGGPS